MLSILRVSPCFVSYSRCAHAKSVLHQLPLATMLFRNIMMPCTPSQFFFKNVSEVSLLLYVLFHHNFFLLALSARREMLFFYKSKNNFLKMTSLSLSLSSMLIIINNFIAPWFGFTSRLRFRRCHEI